MRVFGGVEQGHVGMLRADAAQIVHGGIGVELGDVTHAEFRESCGIVAEPFAQEGRGSDVLQPQVQRRTFLRHAARPQAIHQHPIPVRRSRLFIYTFDCNTHTPHDWRALARSQGETRFIYPFDFWVFCLRPCAMTASDSVAFGDIVQPDRLAPVEGVHSEIDGFGLDERRQRGVRRVVDQVGDGDKRLLDADAHNGVDGTHQQLPQWRLETVQCPIAAHGPRIEQHIVDAASGLLLVFCEGHSQQVVQTTGADSRAMLERD